MARLKGLLVFWWPVVPYHSSLNWIIIGITGVLRIFACFFLDEIADLRRRNGDLEAKVMNQVDVHFVL